MASLDKGEKEEPYRTRRDPRATCTPHDIKKRTKQQATVRGTRGPGPVSASRPSVVELSTIATADASKISVAVDIQHRLQRPPAYTTMESLVLLGLG